MKYILLLALFTLASCSSTYKVYSEGEYESLDSVSMINDSLNDTDMNLISQQMIDSLGRCSKNYSSKPKVILGKIENNTNEHIDLDMILNKIKSSLHKNKNFTFIDQKARQERMAETNYQKVNRTLSSTNIEETSGFGAKYIIQGSIHSTVQSLSDVKKIYYYTTFSLVNLETSAVECIEEKSLKKSFKSVNY